MSAVFLELIIGGNYIKEAEPELYSKYVKAGTSRRFIIK